MPTCCGATSLMVVRSEALVCAGCGDTALMSLVTPATAGLPRLELSDNRSSPLWHTHTKKANGKPVARVTPGCLKSRDMFESRRHRPLLGRAREHRGAALGFCVLRVYGFHSNATIPAINNGLMLSFIWALNVYYIYAFVPHFAQFL